MIRDSDVITRANLTREILRLAVPAALQNILYTALFLVDTKMVAEVAVKGSSAPLAALAVTGPIVWSLTVIATVTSVGTTALVARRIGEGNVDDARRVTTTSVILATVIGLAVGLLGAALAGPVVGLVTAVGDTTPALREAAAGYLFWFMLLFPFRSVAIALQAALRGAGDTAQPLIAGALANVVNMAANALFIFGLLGLPRLGVVGAGVGTGLAGVAEALYLVWILRRGASRRLDLRRGTTLAPTWRWARGIVAVSLPSLLEALIFHAGFMAYQLAIYRLDEASIAAHRIAIALQSAAFMPAAGFYIAASSLSGRLLGARDPALAELAARRNVVVGLVFMAPIAVIFGLFPEALTGAFSERPDHAALAAEALRLGALEIPFLLVTEALRGTLRGSGETREPVIIQLFGTWLVRVPVSWLLAIGCGWGLTGIWTATVLDWVLRAGVTWGFFRSGGWQRRIV